MALNELLARFGCACESRWMPCGHWIRIKRRACVQKLNLEWN